MSAKKWLLMSIIVGLVALVSLKVALHPRTKGSSTQIAAQKAETYWTCPMHPQIHQDHPGECPICHMKLVQVTKKRADLELDSEIERRSPVDATASQLSLVGVQIQEVEKMTLKTKIPVSGRILSSSIVAFQIYEQDLRNVRTGLTFRGNDNVNPAEEIRGVIRSVDPIVDPTSRTVRVIGAIQKGPKELLAETSFRGEIEIELNDRVAIAESSVLHAGGKTLVYLVGEKNQLLPKSVSLGIKTEGFYEVLSGLTPGDKISSGPNFLVEKKKKIRGAND